MKPMLAILLAGLALCTARAQETKEVKNPPQAPWPYARANADGVGKGATTLIIRSEEELIKASGLPGDGRTRMQLADFLQKAFKLDKVDYDKQMLVVITGGTQPSGGFRLEAQKVVADGKTLTIHWKLHAPKDVATAVITHPATLVLVDRSNGEIRFEPPVGKPAKDKK
jgi:hypothetical protein